MSARIWLLSTVSVAAMVAAPALAADLSTGLRGAMEPPPSGMGAVSAPNGKLAGFVGTVDNEFAVGGTGSYAVPLSGPWGAQLDGMLGTAGGGTFYGVGGHLFWRDPSKGLIGATASYVGWAGGATTIGDGGLTPFADITGASVGKIGIEAESYLGRVSLEGGASYQFGTSTGLAGHATAAFYPTDNLRLDLNYSYLQGPGSSVGAGLEWMPNGKALSFFATASVNQSSNWTVLGGVKVYFGDQNKTLINRHREDDPDNLLPTDLYKAMGAQYCTEEEYIDVNGHCDGV
jgi:hypothetical protein